MAQLYFSRDVKVYVQQGGKMWDIPVLDGFSFSQSTNNVEVTLNEMSGTSTRGRKLFNDSLAPAEWAFSTYARPFVSAGSGVGAADTAANHHAVEEVLWALMGGPATYASSAFTGQSAPTTTEQTIDFSESNVSVLGEATIWFEFPDATNPTIYKMTKSCVNEATMNFDIDGIATIDWSGFASLIEESDQSALDAALGVALANVINEGTACSVTSNFIRNRLSTVTIVAADTTTFSGDGDNDGTYNLVLTGGSVTISNNITFLTPSTLGCVNTPLGHVSGTRSVSGSLDCYLNGAAAGDSADFFSDLVNATSVVTNSFAVNLSVGGTASSTNPAVKFTFPTAHFEIPAHDISDVISLTTAFHGLPSTIGGTDEVVIEYKGVALT
jgi:hypothetical protein